MSNPDITTYENPLTGAGVSLGDPSAIGLPSFQIEECGFSPRGIEWNFDAVVSPFWRLYWNADFGSHLLVGGKRWPLKPNSIFLVPEGLRFSTRGRKGTPHLWLHFTALPHRHYDAVEPIPMGINAHIRASLESLMNCWLKSEPIFVYYHRAQALLHTVLARFHGFHRQRLPDSLEKLLAFIHVNRGAPLDNPTLARRCNRSVEGFIRWFHQHMQTTPQHYVLDCRIRQAARELAGREYSIEQIAERNGFPNRNYFTRVFAQNMGYPPGAFRAKSRDSLYNPYFQKNVQAAFPRQKANIRG
jgi:AraC family transcriptional regulator, arabinose operon regulatory protein